MEATTVKVKAVGYRVYKHYAYRLCAMRESVNVAFILDNSWEAHLICSCLAETPARHSNA